MALPHPPNREIHRGRDQIFRDRSQIYCDLANAVARSRGNGVWMGRWVGVSGMTKNKRIVEMEGMECPLVE